MYIFIYIYIRSKTWPGSFPTSKQGGYLIGGNYFHKKRRLRCLKMF